MSSFVLDASAVLAWLRSEPGADTVEPLLSRAVISAVNGSEVAQKLAQHGAPVRMTLERLRVLGVEIEEFDAEDALAAAELWPPTRHKGLSLADRACLALARRLGLPAVTADAAWRELGIEVRLIR